MDDLEPRVDEPVLTKTSHNAFTTTNLQQVLVGQGVGHVVVCGIRTEQCCETTARLASDLGAKVVGVSDARGGIYNPNGLPIHDLYNRYSGIDGGIHNFKECDTVSNEDLLELRITGTTERPVVRVGGLTIDSRDEGRETLDSLARRLRDRLLR